MKINEIFSSIQGESTYLGLPCTFIRTAECNLRCTGCDTKYAYGPGTEMALDEIISKVDMYLVEITGGECLMQKEEVIKLMNLLNASYHKVLIETNGSVDIEGTENAVRIVDVKCPSTGEYNSFNMKNLERLLWADEIKFVIFTEEDMYFASEFIRTCKLTQKVDNIIFSLARGDEAKIKGHDIAQYLLKEKIPRTRMQVQLHKMIDMP